MVEYNEYVVVKYGVCGIEYLVCELFVNNIGYVYERFVN